MSRWLASSSTMWEQKENKLQNIKMFFMEAVNSLSGGVNGERWVTHFVEVLILHSDSTDGVTGVDKFIRQGLLLLDTNLKSYWWEWWISVMSRTHRTVSVIIHWRQRPNISYQMNATFSSLLDTLCWWIKQVLSQFLPLNIHLLFIKPATVQSKDTLKSKTHYYYSHLIRITVTVKHSIYIHLSPLKYNLLTNKLFTKTLQCKEKRFNILTF